LQLTRANSRFSIFNYSGGDTSREKIQAQKNGASYDIRASYEFSRKSLPEHFASVARCYERAFSAHVYTVYRKCAR